ncbi:MAG: RNA-binding transcriptional accessory protein, partial [Oscillospiraceae bacterium]|nr:RNA-binding transcriptional accessory protein [Oscillospiraceae bacterium]
MQEMDYKIVLAQQFGIKPEYAENIIALLDEGNTIPFIARYRKESHGSLDDQIIREFAERLEYLRNLDKRRSEVFELITAQEKMTDDIEAALKKAATITEIDDIYRPFRPKRKTRASVAKEKGLEPLALFIFAQDDTKAYPIDVAEQYVDEEKGVATAEDALQGAMDIIAEIVSDDALIRKRTRNLIWMNGFITSEAAKKATAEQEEKSQNQKLRDVYENYYEFKEPVNKIAGHRLLALNRGEREGFLKVAVEIEPQKILNMIHSQIVKNNSPCADIVVQAAEDSYSRLIFPSVQNDIRNELTDNASTSAIKVFAVNLRQLLMQPPVKGRVVIGLDPGYRTGCKVAVVSPTGKVLDTSVIYPTHGAAQVAQSKSILKNLIKKHGAQLLSIGNGTASKETEIFAAEVISEIDADVKYMMVNEAGASIYSASPLAAAELPELDLTLRSAVSIARRLQDPLAELVKIEPKGIGVGQYQHDMPQKQLAAALDGVVEGCVNSVGADLNTASPALLTHIAGVSAAVAKNIVAYREENGSFKKRDELKKVAKLGPKAFEQCAGFLRVSESKNPLDSTGVHPESYAAAQQLLELCGFGKKDFKNGGLPEITNKLNEIGLSFAAEKLGLGEPTLQDIAKELARPGRDPRDELPAPMLRSDVMDIN